MNYLAHYISKHSGSDIFVIFSIKLTVSHLAFFQYTEKTKKNKRFENRKFFKNWTNKTANQSSKPSDS